MSEGPPSSSASTDPSSSETAGVADASSPQATAFEDVDWERVSPGETGPSWPLRAFLAGLVPVALGFYYEHVAGRSLPVLAPLDPLDWLFAASLVALGAFVAVPLAAVPERSLRYWRRLRRRPLGLASLGVVLAFFAVGLFGPLFVSEPTGIAFGRAYQPPVGTTINTQWLFTPESCVGEVTGERCHGTWRYPLGTTDTGKDMVPFVVLGARTGLVIAVVSATLIVPTGLGVGLVAAYAGGRVDRLLMGVAEVTQAVPAVIVYVLFWRWNTEYRLLMLIAAFGLTSWGGFARLARNEALQLRDRPFVRAARAAGARRRQIVRRHLLPNVSRSVITSVTLQVPLLVVTEAALSFVVLTSPFDGAEVTLGDPTVVSWGQTIYLGTQADGLAAAWWIATVPSLCLVATVLAFNLLGRTLGDVLDPRPK